MRTTPRRRRTWRAATGCGVAVWAVAGRPAREPTAKATVTARVRPAEARKAAGQPRRSMIAPMAGYVAAMPRHAANVTSPFARARDRAGTRSETVRAAAG